VSARDDLERLWATRDSVGDGGREAERALLAGLHQDAELRRALAADDRLDGLLRGLGATSGDGEAFAQRTLAALAIEEDGARLAARVLERFDRSAVEGHARGPLGPGGGGGGGRGRPTLRPRAAAWAMAAAAGAVLALVGLRDRSGPERAPASADRAARAPGPAGRAPPANEKPPAGLRALRPGDELFAEAGERAAGWLGPGATLTAQGPARLRVEAPEPARGTAPPRVRVGQGAVTFDLTAEAPGLVVSLPDLQAVAGPGPVRFSAEARPEGGHLRVETGAVRARGPRYAADVRAGQVAVVRFDDLNVRDPVEPAPGQTPGDTVLSFDFETPPAAELRGGRLTRCPPGASGGSCAVGTRYSRRFARSLGVQIVAREASLFRYDPDLVISFDYWIGAWAGERAPRFTVGLYPAPGGRLHETMLEPPHPQPARWVTVHVRLSDVVLDGRARLEPGTEVRVLRFGTDYAVQDLVYIDNVRVWRPAPR
jgi:hypothetical protein